MRIFALLALVALVGCGKSNPAVVGQVIQKKIVIEHIPSRFGGYDKDVYYDKDVHYVQVIETNWHFVSPFFYNHVAVGQLIAIENP
jgi:hypothetical protein